MTTRVTLAGEEQNFGQCQVVRVSDGQERSPAPHLGEPACGAAMKLQLRRSAASHYLDVAPQDAARVAGAERLHGRFLCGEPPGKMNGWNAAPRAVFDLGVCEDAVKEPLAVPLDRVRDTVDIRGVEPEPDDVR